MVVGDTKNWPLQVSEYGVPHYWKQFIQNTVQSL